MLAIKSPQNIHQWPYPFPAIAGNKNSHCPPHKKGAVVQTYRQILLVGKDQKKGITELVLVKHSLKFLTGLRNTLPIVGVDDEDDALGVLEIMPPQWTNLVLATNVPHGEGDVLVLYGLDIETYTIAKR